MNVAVSVIHDFIASSLFESGMLLVLSRIGDVQELYVLPVIDNNNAWYHSLITSTICFRLLSLAAGSRSV